MITLQFEQQTISLHKGAIPNLDQLTPYQQRIVTFCIEYQAGKSEFEIHTSGSTGQPKLIKLSRAQMQASARASIKALKLDGNLRALICINTDYIGGKMMLVRGMELGMHMMVQSPTSNPSLDQVDFTALVPLQVSKLLVNVDSAKMIAQCAIIIIGGAPIPPDLEEKLKTFENAIYQTFGMTETVSHVAIRRLNGSKNSAAFKILEGVTISQDHRNCLVVAGPMTDYKEVISNDVIDLVDSQHFIWLSRWDQVINSGGYKIYPPKVEKATLTAMKELQISGTALLLPSNDSKLGQVGILVLEIKDLSPTDQKRLLNQLKEKLHPFEVPKVIRTIAQFPRTENDKVDYVALREALK